MSSHFDERVLNLFKVGGQFNRKSATAQEVALALNCREGRARAALTRLEWSTPKMGDPIDAPEMKSFLTTTGRVRRKWRFE